jgi:hypothetical protein
MGKVFFLVWLVYNPNHTVTLSYMGGHEYGSAAACQTMTEAFNGAVDVTKTDFACTTIAPAHPGMVLVRDLEDVADDTDFFIKSF